MFADGKNHKGEDGAVLPIGTPILMQSADNYEDETEIHITDQNPVSTEDLNFKELVTSRMGVAAGGLEGLNTTALRKCEE